VKYMLLIYDNDKSRELFLGPDGKDLMDEMRVLLGEITESGELVYTDGLSDPSNTKTVRVRDGAPVVTDGPLAEAKEYFGGYMVVDCETEERAIEIATRFPGTRFTPVEVRPLMGDSGDEM
jgi:hypothetical protein